MKKLLYFWGEKCEPCKNMKPIIKELMDEGYKVDGIRAELNPELAAKYQVMSVPNFIVLDNDNVTGQLTGSQSLESLKDLLK